MITDYPMEWFRETSAGNHLFPPQNREFPWISCKISFQLTNSGNSLPNWNTGCTFKNAHQNSDSGHTIHIHMDMGNSCSNFSRRSWRYWPTISWHVVIWWVAIWVIKHDLWFQAIPTKKNDGSLGILTTAGEALEVPGAMSKWRLTCCNSPKQSRSFHDFLFLSSAWCKTTMVNHDDLRIRWSEWFYPNTMETHHGKPPC